MAADLAEIELTAKEIVAVFRPELIAGVAMQATGGSRPHMSQHGHQLRRRPRMLVDRIVILAVDTAIDGMD